MLTLEEFGDIFVGRVDHRPVRLDPHSTVLLLIDMQNCVKAEYYEEFAVSRGMAFSDISIAMGEMREYRNEVESNAGRVLAEARQSGIRPVHVRIEASLPDGADVGRLHASKNFRLPPGSWGSQFLPAVSPLVDEIVLDKTCSGAVIGTRLDQVLRNLGTTRVVVIGFYTDQCVSTTVRDLADLGYEVGVVDDASGALTRRRHAEGIAQLRNVYAAIEDTDQFIARARAGDSAPIEGESE